MRTKNQAQPCPSAVISDGTPRSSMGDPIIRENQTLRALVAELQRKLNESDTIARFFMGRTEHLENAYNEAMHKYWDILEENAGNKERLRSLLSLDQPKSSIDPEALRRRSKAFVSPDGPNRPESVKIDKMKKP